MTSILPRERLIVALDLPSGTEAMYLVNQLDDQVEFYKVGLELFSSGSGIQLIEKLVSKGFKVFADFKFFDVPETVHGAVRNVNELGVKFLTVHGDPAIMHAAVNASENLSILAVTVLTSMDDSSLRSLGIAETSSDLVLKRARSAYEAGCAGVIASGREAQSIKEELNSKLLIVSPGIRKKDESVDDQKRTVTVSEAFSAGSDYIVVGRPIRNAVNPRQAAEEIQLEIHRFFRDRQSV